MYDLPGLRAANDRLWGAIAKALRARGMSGVPHALCRDRPLHDLWRAPNLMFAQTCGFPLMSVLPENLTVIGAPVYRWRGCEAATHVSVVIAPVRSERGDGTVRLAVNDAHSNTGANLLRHWLASQRDVAAPFRVTLTGAHEASVEAVAAGCADLAAVDCVTFALLAQERPALVGAVRIIAWSARSPSLPFVCAPDYAGQAGLMREAFAAALASEEGRDAAEVLGIAAIEPAARCDYEIVLRYRDDADAAGMARF